LLRSNHRDRSIASEFFTDDYICNPHDVPKARGILHTYFAGQPPASTLCILRGLAHPNFLLEIEAIAAV
jgi:enamine deaminase RidA (YjgF/YER057c/UK114 family)